jgi:hypothetical protein
METFDNHGNYKREDVMSVCDKHNKQYIKICSACVIEEVEMMHRETAFAYGDWPEEMESDYLWDDTHHFINSLKIK